MLTACGKGSETHLAAISSSNPWPKVSIPMPQDILPTTTTELVRAPLSHIQTPRASRNYGSSGSLGGGWERLRQCEHGGSYDRGDNPRYFGAYQFSQGTWNTTAKRHGRNDLVGVNPGDASPADQDQMAQWLYADSGRGQWPICGKYLS